MIRIASVNIGKATETAVKSGQTGFFKRPAGGRVAVGPLGLRGDVIVDQINHGGPDQAVYLFGTGDLAWWARELGRALPPGSFGENLTIDGLDTADMAIGDRLQIGALALQVTSPRIPCATLAAVFGDKGLPKRFLAAGRCGFYGRVLQTGDVGQGDTVLHHRFDSPRLPVTEMLDLSPARLTPARIADLLRTPLHHQARTDLTAMAGT